MAQERIKLTKKVYDKQSASDLLNRSFSELANSNDSVTNTNLNNKINQLFTLYNDLFYDVPKIGKKSHTSFFQQSRDYLGNYIDSKDTEIDALIERIIELEEKLNTSETPDKEHPFYRNGSIIVDREADWNIYYMEKATRRKLEGDTKSELFIDLLAALGHRGTWTEGVTLVSPSVISNIPPGPRFGPEDLGSAETNVEEETATFADSFNYNALQDGELNPNNYPITEMTRPSNYSSMAIQNRQRVDNEIYQVGVANKNSYDTYREYLKNRITETWSTERRLDVLSDKYRNDIEYSFTQPERDKAQILLDNLGPVLRRSQETLVYYKRLWTFVKNKSANNAQAKKLMLEAQANFENNINTPVADNERNEYGGWKKGKDNFQNIDLN